MARIEPFEKHTAKYEDWFERNRFIYASELAAIKGQLPAGGRGVEIGVGSARFAAPLGVEFGIEPSPLMRKIAEQRGIKVVGSVAEKLPFADDRFDLALMVTTICFLDDVDAAFAEVYRILKPGGCFLIGFIDKNSPLGKSYLAHKTENVFYRVATFYSVEEVVLHLRETGFNDFVFVQTIFHDLREVTDMEPAKTGFGEGSFVVVKGWK